MTNGSYNLYYCGVSETAASAARRALATKDLGPLYKRLAHVLADVDPMTLPPARTLASEIGLNRATVTAAYHELARQGHLFLRPGRPRRHAGTSAQPSDTNGADGPLDLASYTPNRELLPSGQIFQWLGYGASEGEATVAQYGDARGYRPLREWIVARLRRYGVATDEQRVVLTSGVQHGLDLVLRACAEPAQSVLVEDPTYPGLPPLLRLHGLEPIPVPTRAAGLDLDAALTATAQRPNLAILTPTLHNPTGTVLDTNTRTQLAAALRAHSTLVIEEFFDPALLVDGTAPFPLAALDPEVVTVGSFSKALFPGLRVGFLTGPAQTVERVLAVKRSADLSGSPFLEATAFSLCERGVLSQQLDRLRVASLERRQVVLNELRSTCCPTSVPRGGFTLLVELPPGLSSELVAARAAAAGVHVLAGPAMSITRADNIVRIAFAAASGAQLAHGVRVFVNALAGDHGSEPLV